ncbi:hypothetical protein CRE_06981 [Caenorhabditis remanei]|uniref:RING-type domain-containing protein n=1 Tax=Caenorhabditis remanei TaxID=31234 RepID=E3NB48_CAERE|nr:hypothetical protein CRE_06981 [Caenorhabditis remanei]
MASPRIIVSTILLQFYRDKVSTKAIDVTVTVSSLHVKVRHNLPSCFTVDFSSGQSVAPKKVLITFNPSIAFEMPQEHLQIQFIDYFDYLSTGKLNYVTNSVTVFINILEPQTNPNKINHLLSEQLECRICLREFSEDDENLTPRILTRCGHTLCFKCCSSLPGLWGTACPFDTMITPYMIAELPNSVN